MWIRVSCAVLVSMGISCSRSSSKAPATDDAAASAVPTWAAELRSGLARIERADVSCARLESLHTAVRDAIAGLDSLNGLRRATDLVANVANTEAARAEQHTHIDAAARAELIGALRDLSEVMELLGQRPERDAQLLRRLDNSVDNLIAATAKAEASCE